MNQKLSEIAAATCESHPDPKEARRLFTKRVSRLIEEDSELRQEVIGAAFDCLSARYVYGHRHETRAAIKLEAGTRPNDCTRGASAILSARSAVIRSILDWWEVGDKKLGDVLGEELPALEASEQERANGYARNARFYRALRQRTKNGQRIRDALSDQQAETLWTSIRDAGLGGKGRAA